MSCLKGNKKCPCRIWINCPIYIDTAKQQQRLNNRDNVNYEEYYNTIFRLSYEAGNFFANGWLIIHVATDN